MARNILHNYVNWTYNLSLYALSIGEYNANVCNGPTPNPGGTLLIASGGKQAGRNAHFLEDFYFDKMTVDCTAALSTQARNSNKLTLDFTIIEPMGVSFFNRLIAVAGDLGIQKVSEMPYIIKIEWKGYTTDGTPVVIPGSKVFPVQFATISMKINARGAQYDISTRPYNHQAFDESVASSPIRAEISAPSVGEAFLTDINADPPSSDLVASMGKSDDNVRSYAKALNSWFKTQAEEKHADKVDSVVFEMPASIANAKLVDAKQVTVKNLPFPTPGTPESKQDSPEVTNTRPTAKLNGNMSFDKGTAIHEILSAVIRESDHIGNQLKDEQVGEGSAGNKRMEWFKIITRVEVGPYEKAFNRYVKKYIYRVVPFKVDNTKSRSGPISNLGTLPGPVKEYNYIFTGKNDDVLDVDLTFDSLWFGALTTNQENTSSQSGGQRCTPTLDPVAWAGALAQKSFFGGSYTGGSSHFTTPIFPISSTATSIKVLDGSRNEKAREMQEQLMNRSSGDMTSIKLKIVGDPDLIKQDDFMFWNASGPTTPNGSITMDTGEVYIKLTVKTAADYNSQGLAIPGTGGYNTSSFSGMYRINTLMCEFAGGKFTQTLDCTRFGIQPPAS